MSKMDAVDWQTAISTTTYPALNKDYTLLQDTMLNKTSKDMVRVPLSGCLVVHDLRMTCLGCL